MENIGEEDFLESRKSSLFQFNEEGIEQAKMKPPEFSEEELHQTNQNILRNKFVTTFVIAFRMLLDAANDGDEEAREILVKFMKNFNELDHKYATY